MSRAEPMATADRYYAYHDQRGGGCGDVALTPRQRRRIRRKRRRALRRGPVEHDVIFDETRQFIRRERSGA